MTVVRASHRGWCSRTTRKIAEGGVAHPSAQADAWAHDDKPRRKTYRTRPMTHAGSHDNTKERKHETGRRQAMPSGRHERARDRSLFFVLSRIRVFVIPAPPLTADPSGHTDHSVRMLPSRSFKRCLGLNSRPNVKSHELSPFFPARRCRAEHDLPGSPRTQRKTPRTQPRISLISRIRPQA